MMEGGKSLIGLLVAVVIVILASLAFITGKVPGMSGGPERADGKGETLIGKSVYAAKDDVCKTNLGQLRQSIEINTDPVEGTKPETIEDTKLGASYYSCPVGKEAYVYDKATGRVRCPHRGHEEY